MYKLIPCFFIVIMASCSCPKKTAEKAAAENNKTMETTKSMLSDGFTSGVIEYSDKEGDCEYAIKLEKGTYFEATNIEDTYLKDGTKIWFKYRRLRRANKCPKANPIEIEEMSLRE